MELRYSELKFDGLVYTEQWQIDEILIKNKFNWLVSAEIKNARLELFNGTLVWNGGIWYNGNWYFGVWRDGEWRYGTWENGVFYNGVWRNGTFKSGIIFNGKFFKGKIEGGEIRGGQFIDTEIDPKVIEFTGDETKAKQDQAQATQVETQVAQPDPNKVVFHSTQSTETFTTQPKIQQENITYNMKNIKKFNEYSNESVGELEDSFIDINIDQTKLEVTDKKANKLQQKAGIEIIENPSKTDEYNAKMRKGGEVVASKNYPEKSLHFVKKFNDLK